MCVGVRCGVGGGGCVIRCGCRVYLVWRWVWTSRRSEIHVAMMRGYTTILVYSMCGVMATMLVVVWRVAAAVRGMWRRVAAVATGAAASAPEHSSMTHTHMADTGEHGVHAGVCVWCVCGCGGC